MHIFCRFSSIKSNGTRLSNAAMLDIKMNVEKYALRRYTPKHKRIKPIVLRTAKTLPTSMIVISYVFSQKHGAVKMAERDKNARHFWRHSCPACMSGNQPNIFQGGLPNRIVIGMVDADAFNGTYTKNPFNLKNYDIYLFI
jgi:hypothetical protein